MTPEQKLEFSRLGERLEYIESTIIATADLIRQITTEIKLLDSKIEKLAPYTK